MGPQEDKYGSNYMSTVAQGITLPKAKSVVTLAGTEICFVGNAMLVGHMKSKNPTKDFVASFRWETMKSGSDRLLN